MDNIVYFHLNHWMAGDGYPNKEPFITWMDDFKLNRYLCNDTWCKRNKICSVSYPVDMSYSFNITASREWVEKNCPSILNEDKRFQIKPNEDGFYYGPYTKNEFLEWKEPNFGAYLQDAIND